MSKFTLFTFQKNKNELLEKLQLFENIHFKKLTEADFLETKCFKTKSTDEEENEYVRNLGRLKVVKDILEPLKEKESMQDKLTKDIKKIEYDELVDFSLHYDFHNVYENLREIEKNIKDLEQKISHLETQNINNSFWKDLDVSTKELDGLVNTKYLIGTISKNALESFKEDINNKFENCYVEHIGNNKDDGLILLLFEKDIINDLSMYLRDEGFSRATLDFESAPSKLREENIEEIKQLENEIINFKNENKKYIGELPNVEIAISYYESMYERAKANKMFLSTENTMMLDGWLPYVLKNNLTEILEEICKGEYYISFEEVDIYDEEVPIKLENGKAASSFESITKMFGTPMYHELDPTPFMMPFYILFFGIMTGDFGYGLLLFLGTLFALKKLKLKESTKSFVSFLFYCSFGALFAGVIFGSFFGFTFFSPIKYTTIDGIIAYKPILDNNVDLMFMLILSIIIGGGQIIFGLILKGVSLIKNGKVLDAILDSLLIIVTLFSVVLVLLGQLGIYNSPTLSKVSLILFIGCLIGMALTQGRGNATIVGKIAGGLYEVYGLTGYIGDFVSYTRLVALALSGSYVALSFNQMIGDMPVIARFTVGVVIFILAHAMNIGLTLLSAYVHSSRLQYVEFFGKFFDGGGVPFEPLKLNKDYVLLSNDKNESKE